LEACRIALLIFCHTSFLPPTLSSRIVENLKPQLEVALNKLFSDQNSFWWRCPSQAELDFLLWILFLNVHVCNEEKPEERKRLVTLLMKIAKLLGLCKWLEIRSHLIYFFYTDRVYEESYRRIWREVKISMGYCLGQEDAENLDCSTTISITYPVSYQYAMLLRRKPAQLRLNRPRGYPELAGAAENSNEQHGSIAIEAQRLVDSSSYISSDSDWSDGS
jgi:hypothetical protein